MLKFSAISRLRFFVGFILTLSLLIRISETGQVSAQQFEAIVSNGKLPTSRHYTAAVYDEDDSIYVFGGRTLSPVNGYTNEIIKYSVSTEKVEVVGYFSENVQLAGCVLSKLPNGITNNKIVYCFTATGDGTDESIWQIFLDSNSDLEVSPVIIGKLPPNGYYRNVVYDSLDSVWIFPGYVDSQVLHFNISTVTLSTAADLMITDSYRSSSVWANSSAYIFGGRDWNANGNETAEIVQYNPNAPDGAHLVVLSTELPYPVAYTTSCTSAEDTAYIISGYSPEILHKMSSLNWVTGQTQHHDVINFDKPLRGASCVYVSKNNRIYVFGGDSDLAESDEIIYIKLS